MNCPRCKTAHPDGKNYCSDCGTQLNPSLTYLEDVVRDQIKESLEARFKDQKLVFVHVRPNQY